MGACSGCTQSLTLYCGLTVCILFSITCQRAAHSHIPIPEGEPGVCLILDPGQFLLPPDVAETAETQDIVLQVTQLRFSRETLPEKLASINCSDHSLVKSCFIIIL